MYMTYAVCIAMTTLGHVTGKGMFATSFNVVCCRRETKVQGVLYATCLPMRNGIPGKMFDDTHTHTHKNTRVCTHASCMCTRHCMYVSLHVRRNFFVKVRRVAL